MQISIRNYQEPKFLQEGGTIEDGAPMNEAPVEEQGAPAPEQGGDPMQQLIEMFAQGLQNQDCNLLAQAAQMFLQAVSGGAEQAPAEAPGQPVYRRGGRLVRWEQR